MTALTLPLKKKWFDLIKAGTKKEEYREGSAYWRIRLQEWRTRPDGMKERVGFKTFDTLVLTLGYPKAGDSERRLVFKNPKIRIGEGRPEWGAEPEKMYFVITWEEALVSEDQNFEARR